MDGAILFQRLVLPPKFSQRCVPESNDSWTDLGIPMDSEGSFTPLDTQPELDAQLLKPDWNNPFNVSFLSRINH